MVWPDFNLHGYEGFLLDGAFMTVKLGFCSLILGLGLGAGAMGLKLSQNRICRGIGTVYGDIFRALPELLVVFLMYYGLDAALNGVLGHFLGWGRQTFIGSFLAGTLALGLIFGAYASEVFRGAYLGIAPGQREAARALGLGRWTIFVRVTGPQMVAFSLPALGNLVLILIKDTTLVSVIFLTELMRAAVLAGRATGDMFAFLAVAALGYLVISAGVSGLWRWLEARTRRWSDPTTADPVPLDPRTARIALNTARIALKRGG